MMLPFKYISGSTNAYDLLGGMQKVELLQLSCSLFWKLWWQIL